MSKKVAIITELKKNKFNYGGTLQAYALNKYLNDCCDIDATTLYISEIQKKEYANKNFLIICKKNIKSIINCLKNRFYIDKCNFYNFINENIKVSKTSYTYGKLKKTNFDIYIVGSDVVWIQGRNYVNKIKFLDFNNGNAKKISYAASFGGYYIPKENEKLIKEKLEKFDAISLRENSMTSKLENIINKKVYHVLDPTLLINETEWLKMCEKPKIKSKKYVLYYVLGNNNDYLESIKKFTNNHGYELIIINDINSNKYTDKNINNCTINNWLWLISNAEYIFTDSFHGVVFSTIFKKKFLVFKRKSKNDINLRINDYLSLIKQENKCVDFVDEKIIKSLSWNYESIGKIIDNKINDSKKFLDEYVLRG